MRVAEGGMPEGEDRNVEGIAGAPTPINPVLGDRINVVQDE